jgi:tetratricopeptide (TPR) repeat protein
MFSFVSAMWSSADDASAQDTVKTLEIADALMAVKNYQAAMAIYNRLIRHSENKNIAQAYYKRSIALYAQGKIELAISDAESACTHNSTAVTKLYNSNNNCRNKNNADFSQYQQHKQFAADILHYIMELKQTLIITPQTLTAPSSPLTTQGFHKNGLKRRSKSPKVCDKVVAPMIRRM